MKTYLSEEEQAHGQSDCNLRGISSDIRREIQQQLNDVHRCLIKHYDRLHLLREMIWGSAVLGRLYLGFLNTIIDLLFATIIIIIVVMIIIVSSCILLIHLVSVILLLI